MSLRTPSPLNGRPAKTTYSPRTSPHRANANPPCDRHILVFYLYAVIQAEIRCSIRPILDLGSLPVGRSHLSWEDLSYHGFSCWWRSALLCWASRYHISASLRLLHVVHVRKFGLTVRMEGLRPSMIIPMHRKWRHREHN